jgi:hypothetical protein
MNASTTELRQEIARSHLVLVESIATARTWGLMPYIVLGGALLGTMAAGFGWLKGVMSTSIGFLPNIEPTLHSEKDRRTDNRED